MRFWARPGAQRTTAGPTDRYSPHRRALTVGIAALGATGSLQSVLLGKAAHDLGNGIVPMLTAATLAAFVGLCGLTVWILSSCNRREQLRAVRGPHIWTERARWELSIATVAGILVGTAQGGLVPRLGVALFTLAFVTGQAATGLVADALGLGGGPQRRVSLNRLLAIVVAVLGVAMSSFTAADGALRGGDLAIIAVAALVGGALAVQQAANGRLARATDAPAVVALANFVFGVVASSLVLLVLTGVGDPSWPRPHQWWPYAGGLIGAAVVAATAAAVPKLGVLTVAISLVLGQVIGALIITTQSTSAPPPLASICGAALVLVGVGLVLGRPGHPEKSM